MRILFATLVVALLGACSTTFDGHFANRLACTSQREAYVVSLWSKWIGIATEIDKRDAPSACQAPTKP